MLVALEAVLRGGPFDRACFCAAHLRTSEFRARFGLGRGVEAFVERLVVPFAHASEIGTTLLRGKEVVLVRGGRHAASDATLLKGWGATSAALFSISVGGTTIGAIYADRTAVASPPDAATLTYARRVVANAAQAIALRRSAPPR